MKILMVSPYPPYPPNNGARIRQWELIKYLGQRHDITVVYYAFTEKEYGFQKSIAKFCNKAIEVKHPHRFPSDLKDANKLPWPVRVFKTTEMMKTLAEINSVNYDAAIIEFIFMPYYHEAFPVCSILHEHNIESNIFKQYAEIPNVSEEKIFGIKKDRTFWNATWMLMAEYENKMWPKFPLRVTVSENDKQEMDRRCSSGRTIVIENGVNIHTVNLIRSTTSRKILFMGTLDYYPNTDAASFLVKSVMPFVWRKDPGISLCIAGSNPPQSVTELASDPRVEVIGNPDDMREVAAKCCLTVVPLRLGGGTRIKILDSMAMGLPVVSTSLGCEGLTVSDGMNILIRDDPGQFADAVLQIYSDDILKNTLRVNGRRLAEERYDWERIFTQFESEMVLCAEKIKKHGTS